MREALQTIGEVGGAVELDQTADERADDDVQFYELVHCGHPAGCAKQMRNALLARMPRNAAGHVSRFRLERK